jgi:hypothetical protein
MKESIFNLFVFVEHEYIRRLGAVAHEVEGSDSEKVAYLRAKAASDAGMAGQHQVPSRYTFRQEDGTYIPGINYRLFQQMTFGGRLFEVFEEVFDGLGASSQPLVVVTPVVDGVIRVDRVGDLPAGPPPADRVVVNRFPIVDYLAKYLTKKGLTSPDC